MTKAELRREMRQRLRTVGETREEKSRAIAATIATHPSFLRGGCIAVFSPLPGEPDVNLLWEKAQNGFAYPRVTGEQIAFVRVTDRDDLVPAAWNPWILEPTPKNAHPIAPEEITLLLVPGLAFTRAGLRLGRGGGFYDRYLARLTPQTMKLGVCFDFQMVETLPAESHDQRVDEIVTESGLVATLH